MWFEGLNSDESIEHIFNCICGGKPHVTTFMDDENKNHAVVQCSICDRRIEKTGGFLLKALRVEAVEKWNEWNKKEDENMEEIVIKEFYGYATLNSDGKWEYITKDNLDREFIDPDLECIDELEVLPGNATKDLGGYAYQLYRFKVVAEPINEKKLRALKAEQKISETVKLLENISTEELKIIQEEIQKRLDKKE